MRKLLLALVLLLCPSCATPAPNLDESVVYIEYGQHLCTGFVIDEIKHRIMTAAHCTPADQHYFNVQLLDGQRFVATKVGVSKDRDLAILEVPDHVKLKAVRFGDSDRVKVGDEVTAVGHPHGVKWVHRSGPVIDVFPQYINSIDTIRHGNSGGPLYNAKGEVIGVNVMCYSMFMQPCAIGISISSNDALAIIRLIGDGENS